MAIKMALRVTIDINRIYCYDHDIGAAPLSAVFTTYQAANFYLEFEKKTVGEQSWHDDMQLLKYSLGQFSKRWDIARE